MKTPRWQATMQVTSSHVALDSIVRRTLTM